ncbi:hypothetical protein Y032_0032g2452 [Ancylostoma ceylanicum]|uniref:NADH dehydrogenase [ubiquinone] 1 alpha subcomplex subunit 2 n=1 Tax=Ancylostoma ceylanicum TaxID=53326 RepID=A0A016UP63_9BILA|nr:hypothetical protein Y032_0032g2452 [Ancylostoma ceylanicum]
MASAIRLAGSHLRELRIHLCQKSPASAGVRAFIESDYVGLKQANPQFPILIRECSGIVPRVFASFNDKFCDRYSWLKVSKSRHRNSWFTVKIQLAKVAKLDTVVKKLKCKSEHMLLYTKETQPPRWHYRNASMGGDLVLVGRDGAEISSSESEDKENVGNYGGDFIDPSTHTIFFAMGPAIRRRAVLPVIQNVEFMNLWTSLLDIPRTQNDGEEHLVDLVLKHPKHLHIPPPTDIPSCEYTVTGDIIKCGYCQPGHDVRLKKWLRECRGSSPVVKPAAIGQANALCFMPICDEGIIRAGKQVSLIEVYDLRDDTGPSVSCPHVTQRYHEQCPKLSTGSSSAQTPLSAYPERGIANHLGSHVLLRKNFIRGINLTPISSENYH